MRLFVLEWDFFLLLSLLKLQKGYMKATVTIKETKISVLNKRCLTLTGKTKCTISV